MSEQLTQSLFANVSAKNGILTVGLIGPSIGQREVPIITEMVGPAIQQTSPLRFVVFNMSPITFVNSMGLGMFIELRNRAHKVGAKVALLGMNEQLTGLFKMVKVDRLFAIVKDEAELAKITGE